MKILAIGINQKTAPIELREKFYLAPLEKELLLSEFKSDPSVMAAIILSTCNRCEIYATVVEDCDPLEIIKRLFRIKHQVMTDELYKIFYILEGPQAVEHFLKVACGLNSLILGEKQILGQVKDAVNLSREHGMMDRNLNILTNFVIETGKKARQDTQIDFGGVSVSAAAVTMAQNLLGSLEGKSVLVIGSGKMGCLALNYLRQKKTELVYLMNRTSEKAEVVAQEFQAQSVDFWDMKEVLAKVDVCICSSAAPHYLITKDLVETVIKMRSNPLICIDISMPRNIDPQVADVDRVQLISLDDLDRVIEGNLQKRQGAVRAVEDLISRKLEEFYKAILKIQMMETSANNLISGEMYENKKS
jgi:glutamyl-tRNA reductase